LGLQNQAIVLKVQTDKPGQPARLYRLSYQLSAVSSQFGIMVATLWLKADS